MSEVIKGIEIDLGGSKQNSITPDDIPSEDDSSTRKKKINETKYDYLIDAFYVSSGDKIPLEKLKRIYGIIAEVTDDGTKRGKIAQDALNASAEYKEAVNELTSTTGGKEVIGAMAHKERNGRNAIEAITLNTNVEENPITITIKLKSGKSLFWDMPQEKLYELQTNGERKEIEDVKKAEELYKIILPRKNECILGTNQENLDKENNKNNDDKLNLGKLRRLNNKKLNDKTIDFGRQ